MYLNRTFFIYYKFGASRTITAKFNMMVIYLPHFFYHHNNHIHRIVCIYN
ncbi:MAG: hypothetical protein RL065_2132 [Bacteroidota bacterium]